MPSTFKTLILALLITFSFLAVSKVANANENSSTSIESSRTVEGDIVWFSKACFELMQDIGHEFDKSARLRAGGFENKDRIAELEKYVLPLSEIYKNLCKE